MLCVFFFFQAEDGIRDYDVTGVQTCALPILRLMTEDVHHFIEGMGRTDDMTMAVLKLSVS